jgi:hypothetical protein
VVAAVDENAKRADFDPFHKWFGIPPEDQPPTHYRLLGLHDFESDPEVIPGAVMRQSARLRIYQLGQHAHARAHVFGKLISGPQPPNTSNPQE